MANEKQSRFGKFLTNLLYAFLVAGHHEDYVHEENGKTVVTPFGVWQATAMQNGKGSR